MNKIQLLKALIAKETDPNELEKLNNQLIDAIREDEREKLEKQFAAEQKKAADEAAKKAADEKAAKDLEDARAKSSGRTMFTGPGRIEVVSVGDYKGMNLKRAAEVAIAKFSDHPTLKNAVGRMIERPEALEGVLKHFTDLYERASNPVMMKAAMQEGTPSEGGYITPVEQRAEVLAYIREASVALPNCTHVPMTSDSMTLPRELTQVTVGYTDEESEATETEPTLDQVTLTAKRMDAYSITSNELLQDNNAPGGIIGLLLSQFVEAVGQKVDSTVFKGTGAPVSGVFLSAGYSQVFGTGSAAFSMIVEADIRKIIGKIPTSRLGNAKFYFHRSPLWDYVYGIKDTTGRNIFIQSNTAKAPHMLMGYPVEIPEAAPSTSGASTGMGVFGDLKGFWIGDRLTNISLFVDPYTLSAKYQTRFLMFTRWAYAHALPNYYGRIVTSA